MEFKTDSPPGVGRSTWASQLACRHKRPLTKPAAAHRSYAPGMGRWMPVTSRRSSVTKQSSIPIAMSRPLPTVARLSEWRDVVVIAVGDEHPERLIGLGTAQSPD